MADTGPPADVTPDFSRSGRGPQLPAPQVQKAQWQRASMGWMREAHKGKLAATGRITLAANAAASVVTDSRAGPTSYIGFMPVTAAAAAEHGNLVVVQQGNGTFTVQHTSNAVTDRTYIYCIMG